MRELYQDDDGPVPLTDPSTVVATVVLRLDGDPVACGALRDLVPGSWGDGGPAPGTGEIERMFVRRDRRGLGLSRRVLVDREQRALARGLRRVVLETGTLQTAAIALYERSGDTRTRSYGGYAAPPIFLCYAEELAAARGRFLSRRPRARRGGRRTPARARAAGRR